MSAVVSKPLTYRPDIDGLRALAILLVVLCHAGVIFRGGFLGVDVFFVISGYLITSLVRREIAEGRFSLARFWMRRVHRLLPALLAASLTTIGLGCLLLMPGDLAELGRSVAAQSLLLANVFFWQTSDYFAGPAAQKPLIHYWSLAVEEQFYLFYPLFLLLRPRKSLAFLGVGSFALLLAFNHAQTSACFYLLPFRAWELLMGGGLAVSGWEVPAHRRKAASWLGFLAIVATALLIHEHKVLWPGITTVIPCLGTCLLIASCRQGDSPVARALSHPKVVRMGLVSYSWYLWHWPLIAYWNYWKVGHTPLLVRIALILAGYLLGSLSYRFVETPFRKPRPGWGPGRVLALAAAIQFAFVLTGLGLNSSGGWPQRLPTEVERLTQRGDPPWSHYQVTLEDAREGKFVTLGTEGPVALWLWGDSHAMAVIPALEKAAVEHHCRVTVATHSGAVPLLDYPAPNVCPLGKDMPEWNRQVLAHWKADHSHPPILLVCRWSYQPEGSMSEDLSKTRQAIAESGGKLYLMKEVPVYPYDPRKALLRQALFHLPDATAGMSRQDYLKQNAAIEQAISAQPAGSVEVLDPAQEFFRESSRARVQKDGRSLYWDDNHLSAPGALLLSPLLAPLTQ